MKLYLSAVLCFLSVLLQAATTSTYSVSTNNNNSVGTISLQQKVVNETNVVDDIVIVNQPVPNFQTNFYNSNIQINVTNVVVITTTNQPPIPPTPTNPPTSGNSWYVRSSSQGSGSGKDWNNAWSLSSIVWSSVQPGDTIWVAGGNYGGLKTLKNGAAGKPIYIKKVTSSDITPVSAAGWNASFDSQAVLSGNPVWFDTANTGSYLYFDGGKPDGFKFTFNGSSFGSCAVFFSAGGMHDITFTNIDMAGPGGSTAYNFQGDCSVIGLRPQMSGGGSVYNVTVANTKLHGGPNLVYNLGANHHFYFINCKFYDNGSANSSIHANMVYTSGSNYEWYWINCEFWNWQVEGINLYQQTSNPHYIIGCVFRDPMTSGARCFWLANESGSPTGPVYLYNNTFVGVNITISESRASMATSNSKARNNIYWNSSFWSGSSIADSDYNFSNGSIAGANSIGAGSNPFVNEASNDFRIVSTVGAKYPRNKGVAIVLQNIPINTDMDGNIRGNDGSWDIGAFESK